MELQLLLLLGVSVALVHASGYVPLNCDCGPKGANNTDGYCESCNQRPSCLNVPYLPGLLSEVAYYSPFYLSVISTNPLNIYLDNVCYTYFLVNQQFGLFLLFVSEVYNDGSTNFKTFLAGDVPGESGKVFFEGFEGPVYTQDGTNDAVSDSAVAGTEVILGSVCNGLGSVFYRCYQFANNNNPDVFLDFRYGSTNVTDLPPQCKQQMKDIANNPRNQFQNQCIRTLPNTRPYQCITSFQGASCIGASKVNATNSRSIP